MHFVEPRFSKAIVCLVMAGSFVQLGVTAAAEAAATPVSADARARDERMARVEDARLRGDLPQLQVMRDRVEALLSNAQADPALRYDAAYTLLRSHILMRVRKVPAAERAPVYERARSHTAWLLERDPKDVEARVLESALIGEAATRSMFARMRDGRASYAIAKETAEQAPEHPRARLQWGVILFHAPSMFGGGHEPAGEHFEAARTLFDARGDATHWPNWGDLDADAWLGQALARGGKKKKARASYLRALERKPDYEWIRAKLLPDLTRAAKP